MDPHCAKSFDIEQHSNEPLLLHYAYLCSTIWDTHTIISHTGDTWPLWSSHRGVAVVGALEQVRPPKVGFSASPMYN